MKNEIIINNLSDLKHRIFPRPFERIALEGKRDLIGAEIGVYKGEHAESLLKHCLVDKLYLVDPYNSYDNYDDAKVHYGKDQDTLEVAEKEAMDRLYGFKFRTNWIKKMSSDALEDIPNNLDFVYLDGNHQYEFIKEDIENYYPKVKDGGVLGGHDFYNGFCHEHNGVIRAVTEFVVENKLQLYAELPDWWVIK